MLNQEPTCRGKECKITKNLFYCHKADSPRCLKCSDPCSVCKKQRNKPLAEYLKKFATKGNTQCKKCKTETSKQWLMFSCDHSYCVKCVCKKFCIIVKQIISTGYMNSNFKSIKCDCGMSSPLNIGSLLERFCFCCGQNLKEKVIALRFKLIINSSCKMRIRFDSESFDLGKTYIEKSIYEQLVAKCKKCNNKIEQAIEREQLCEKSNNICKNCRINSQDVDKKVNQLQKNKVKNDLGITNVKQEDSKCSKVKKDQSSIQRIIPKVIVSDQKVVYKKCVTCSREFTKNKFISIQKINICLECHYNSQQNSIVKNREIQFKRCEHCYQFYKANSMLMKQSICFCSKCYNKFYNEQKQNQSIKKLSQSVNQSFYNPKQDKRNVSTSNMKKKQAQRCILCFQKIFSSERSQKSEQLGCTICNKCQLTNGSFYSQQSNSKIQKKYVKHSSLFQVQEQLQKKSSLDRPKMKQQKPHTDKIIYKSSVRKGKQINFEPFQKNVRLSFEKQKIKNISIKDRQYVPSIIQADVQPYDLKPSIQEDTLISCFICGYFFSQKFSLAKNPTEPHKCIICNMQKYSCE